MEKIVIYLLIIIFIICSYPPIIKYLRWRKNRNAMDNKQKIFDTLYAEINATEVSLEDRSTLTADTFGLVYGEIVFESFANMLQFVDPKPNEVFYDLGSGAGKAVFCSALLYDWKKCYGIELLPGLHQLSVAQLERFNQLPEVKKFFPHKNFPIQFVRSNMLEYDFTDADVIFINATSYTAEFWEAIIEKLNQLKIGTRIILTTKKLESSHYQLLDAQMHLMSWGFNSVNIYKKIT